MTTTPDATTVSSLAWFKSSYSAGSASDCVEAAHAPATTYVRDSKDASGDVLAFPASAFTAFLWSLQD